MNGERQRRRPPGFALRAAPWQAAYKGQMTKDKATAIPARRDSTQPLRASVGMTIRGSGLDHTAEVSGTFQRPKGARHPCPDTERHLLSREDEVEPAGVLGVGAAARLDGHPSAVTHVVEGLSDGGPVHAAVADVDERPAT